MTTPDTFPQPAVPTGRSSGRVTNASAFAQARTPNEGKSDDEKFVRPTSHNTRRLYVTANRIDQLSAMLSARDWTILATIGCVRLASAMQLERLCFLGVSTRRARQSLACLVDRGVLARLPRVVGGVRAGSSGYVYTLDVAGARLLRPQRRFRRPDDPGERFLRHSLAVTELYTRLVEADRAGGIELHNFQAEPASWRPYAGAAGRAILKPDAHVVTRSDRYEDRWFIEVDRATEAVSVVARKCEAYRRYRQTGTEQHRFDVFPRVLFLVPDERRYNALLEVFGRQPADAWDLFTVAQFDEAVTRIARGAGE